MSLLYVGVASFTVGKNAGFLLLFCKLAAIEMKSVTLIHELSPAAELFDAKLHTCMLLERISVAEVSVNCTHIG